MDAAERFARSGHLPAGATGTSEEDAGPAVPGADWERDGVRLAVPGHYGVRSQAEARNTGGNSLLPRPERRAGCHRGASAGAGRHREGGEERVAGAEQPAGEQGDAPGGWEASDSQQQI